MGEQRNAVPWIADMCSADHGYTAGIAQGIVTSRGALSSVMPVLHLVRYHDGS